jgi:hypothetical protein
LQNLPKNNSGQSLPEYERLILEASKMLKDADKASLTIAEHDEYSNLETFLSGLYYMLAAIPGVISKAFFKHEMTPKTIILR